MTVWNEQKAAEREKYWYLSYIEFQEMLCRLALFIELPKDYADGNRDFEPKIEHKVHNFLRIIYEKRYQ